MLANGEANERLLFFITITINKKDFSLSTFAATNYSSRLKKNNEINFKIIFQTHVSNHESHSVRT